MGVAHGVHSITLQELHYFFDDKATIDNNIPIVNFDLSSSTRVLPSVPDLKLDNTFVTPSMHSVDHILTNWENENFFMKGSSVLELLVHNLHMNETLSMSGKFYEKNKRNPGGEIGNLCKCIKEVEGDILDTLEATAKLFRRKKGQNSWRGYYGGRTMKTKKQKKIKETTPNLKYLNVVPGNVIP